MRSLHRNWRGLWYAGATESRPIVDEYGNDTLEVETLYSPALFLMANVSANMGAEAVEVFGSQTEYSRTMRKVTLTIP